MTPKTIAIIGGTGKMGSLFAKSFQEKGYEVLIAGRKTATSHIEAAKRADVVIVSVPISATESVIKEISPHLQKGALISDFTSVKTLPIKAMKKHSKSEVIGGHPLFGPDSDLKGNTFVLCQARGSKYLEWYKGLLESMGLNVVLMSADEHDKQMAIIQCLNHLSNLSFASSLNKLGFNLNSNLLTPAFILKKSVIGRTLFQDEGLYAEIEINNPYSKAMAKTYLNSVKEIKHLIDKKDENGLKSEIIKLKNYFGPNAEKSLATTSKILKILKGEEA